MRTPLAGLVDRPAETPRGFGDLGVLLWIVSESVVSLILIVCMFIFA